MFGRWSARAGEYYIGIINANPSTRAAVRAVVQRDPINSVYDTQLGHTVVFVEDDDIDGLPWVYCSRPEDSDAVIDLLATLGVFTRPVTPPWPEGCV